MIAGGYLFNKLVEVVKSYASEENINTLSKTLCYLVTPLKKEVCLGVVYLPSLKEKLERLEKTGLIYVSTKIFSLIDKMLEKNKHTSF